MTDHEVGAGEVIDTGRALRVVHGVVRSRARATSLPRRTICRIANGRPNTHMFRCTPQRIT